MDYGLIFYLKTFFCLLRMLTDGLEWCGLLVDYCDVFIRLSFWRHPFTAEHPLLRQWCNDTFLQIWWRSKIILILDGLRMMSILDEKVIWFCLETAVTHIHLLVEPALHQLSLLFQLQTEQSESAMLFFLQQTQISKLLAPVCVNEHTYVRNHSWPVRVYLCYTITCNPKNAWHPFFCQTYILKCFLSIQWKSKWFSYFFCVLQTGLERQDGE